MNKRLGTVFLGLMVLCGLAGPALAQKINCANEFRSGKLYFSQSVYDKSVTRFARSVEVCPDKWEYRARYAMALCEFGNKQLMDALTVAETREEQDALIDSSLANYALAGSEFDAAVEVGDGKKPAKFVRENREHYWVEHFNRGIKLAEDEKFTAADREFRLARLVDPRNPKAYHQGAISLIKLEDKIAAAELVEKGLELDPEDKKLNELLEKIFLDAGKTLTVESEAESERARADKNTEVAESAVKKALDAEEYFSKVSTRREDADANVLFDRGVARMAAGLGASARVLEGTDPDAAGFFQKAAEDFAKAAEMVPAESELPEDRQFHLNCLFNEVQALLNARDLDGASAVINAYLTQNCMDTSIWRMYATILVSQELQNEAVSALMVSKSLDGQEVPVGDGVQNANSDAAEALTALGEPNKIYTYQETDSGNQINTWFWPEKKTVISFILGVKNGEISW